MPEKKARAKRVSRFPLTEDAKKNVSGKANYRLITATKAVRNLGNCCGKLYDWDDAQIDAAEKLLTAAVKNTISQIRNGKKNGVAITQVL